MKELIDTIKRMKKWAFWTVEKPANTDYNFNSTVPTAGKQIDVTKELGGQIPKTIEIKCAQNFTLQYGFKKVADKTWPDTLVAASWHKWNNRAYKTIKIVPAVAGVTKIIISAVDPKG